MNFDQLEVYLRSVHRVMATERTNYVLDTAHAAASIMGGGKALEEYIQQINKK